jgi:hypothetical protein
MPCEYFHCNIFSKYYKVIKSIDYVIFLITKYRLEYFVILPWSNLEYLVILPWSNLEYFVILSQGSREYACTEFRLIGAPQKALSTLNNQYR